MADLLDRGYERAYHFLRGFTPRRIKARWTGPRVLANSIPKSGTNLLLSCLAEFPNLRPSFEHVSMGSNRTAGTAELRGVLEATGRGQYSSGHVFHTPETRAVVERTDVRMLLVVRDPRDVVTSHFHFVSEKHTGHRLHDHYRSLPDEEARLMASIRGVDGVQTRDGKPLESIGEWLDAFLGWKEEPYVQLLRFEDLVGTQGGGSRTAQMDAVRAIAGHLDVELDERRVESIAAGTFSTGSSTFRKGLIGDWRNHFTDAHVTAFKDEVGDELQELGYETNADWNV
ncbi:MAG TPA: sulfotransferase domain-containing protein [Halobacteriales archaeon]|nr:sulfotransferase domain-containing protein [Halobacteriales archaeon]